MHEQTKDFFETAPTKNFRAVEVEQMPEIDGTHGWIETRDYCIASVPEYVVDTACWKGLKGIGCVTRKREVSDKVSTETAYYLLSYDADVRRFAQSVRGHWGIENALHWSLDVSFNEDQSRVRKGYAGENLAVIRYIALNWLKPETTMKRGIAAKRKRAGWDNCYLLMLLALVYPAM